MTTTTEAKPITEGTVFLHKNDWLLSVRTGNGFRHLFIGRVTGTTKEQAEALVAEGRVFA